MQLSSKDIVPTIVAVAAAYIGLLAAQGKAYPLVGSQRMMIVVLFAVGMLTCATSGLQTPDWKNAFIITASVVGSLAVLIAVYGLFKPSATVVSLLAWTIVGLWVIATIRRATTV